MDDMTNLAENWDYIKQQLKNEFDVLDTSYKIWIMPLRLHSVENGLVTIEVGQEHSVQMGLNYINKNYRMAFMEVISRFMNMDYDVQFIPNSAAAGTKENINNVPAPAPLDLEAIARRSNLNPKYTFETFIVGSNNRLARNAAYAVAENPGYNNNNPLFLYGGPGLGKTHLMHSIGHHIIRKFPEKVVLYVTSETFTNELVDSIKLNNNQAMSKFREKYRSVDVILLDDIQFIIGKERTQEEFFNTFNDLYSNNKAIILTSDKPPKDMKTLEERYRQRIEWGLPVDISPPDYETRMAILQRYMESRGKSISDEILQYIASNIKSNIRELEGALNKIIAMNSLDNQEITLETAEKAVRDMISADAPRKITLDIILEEVCKYYDTTLDSLTSKRRDSKVVHPRHVAMYLCRNITDSSQEEIGRILGDRDHSTVINACKKIETQLSTDAKVKDEIDSIMKQIFPG